MIEGFYRSCYDVRWLLSRREATMGRALGHLAVLAVILSIGRAATLVPAVREMVERASTFINSELPEIRIEDGKASVDAPQPWAKAFDSRFQVVIDTTGATQIDAAYPTGVLVTSDKIVYKQGPGASREFQLAPVKSFSTRGPKMREWIDEVRAWVGPVVVPTTLFLTVVGLLMRWALTSAIFTGLAGPLGSTLEWRDVFKIGAYAATPTVYLLLLGALTPLRVLLVPTLAHMLFLGLPIWISKELPAGADSNAGTGNGYHPEPPAE